MKSVLTGTVTFLLTNVEGSARLWEHHPDEMPAVLERHDRLVAEIAAASGGTLHKSRGEGDSTFCVFARAGDAVASALAIQRALDKVDEGPRLHVRMALHSGVAELRDGDYFGPVVNRCARLRSAAHGGQILLSSVTAELAQDELPDGSTLRELGLIRLKDLARPERVYQLIHTDLRDVFPPPRGLDEHRHNIPVQTSTLIGREAELKRARALMERPEFREITFTGAGGIGKTRLALQVAADAADLFPGGVWLVPLSAIDDPALVVRAVAQVLEIREETGDDVEARVTNRLAEEPALLLLDNFEQVIAAADLVSRLLAACHHLVVLVTSRESLHLRGEHDFPVPPLSCPRRGEHPELPSLSAYEAVAMFIDRALAVRPGFRVTNDNAGAVAQICARLEGVPLAIELAAARIKLFSPQALLQRLEENFDVLGAGARDLPERHRTLQAAIGWSYELLDEPERALLRRLSVFVGGCTLESAEAVCADGGSVLDGMASLLDKSLLRQEEQTDDEPRFVMLATIREFATAKLRDSGEREPLRARHFAWFASMAQRAAPHLEGPEQRRWLDALEHELDNLRAALRWGQVDDNDPAGAVTLALDLAVFWATRGYVAEGRVWLQRGSLDERIDVATRTRAAEATARLAREVGDFVGSRTTAELGLALARAHADKRAEASLLIELGMTLDHELRGDEAIPIHERAVEMMREIGDVEGSGRSLFHLGAMLLKMGRYERARGVLEESLTHLRAVDDKITTPYVMRELSHIAATPREARARLDEALSIRMRTGDARKIGGSLCDIGLHAFHEGDHATATAYLEQALERYEAVGDHGGAYWTVMKLSDLAYTRGDYPEAERRIREALASSVRTGERPSPWVYQQLGSIALARGDYVEAIAQFEGQLDRVRELGDREFEAWAIRNIGDVAFFQGDEFRARARYGEALSLATNKERKLQVEWRLGNLEKEAGDFDAADGHYATAIDLAREISASELIVLLTTERAMLAARAGDLERARALSAQAIDQAGSLSPRVRSLALRAAAVVAMTDGMLEEAEQALTEGLTLVRAIPETPRLLKYLDRFAELRIAQGRPLDAVRVLAAADAAREATGAAVHPIVRPRIDAAVRVARTRLTPQAFDSAWAGGRALSVEQAVEEVLSAPPAETATTPAEHGENRFLLEGEYWLLQFGGELARVKDAKGLHYIRHLLGSPGRELHVLELSALLEGHAPAGRARAEDGLAVSDHGMEVLDRKALTAYRARIAELQEEITEANEWADDERAAHAREELDRLTEELARAAGFGGRVVRTGSSAERARSTVTKAIKSGLGRIAKAHPSLARHLTATIKTGILCSYNPDPRVAMRWRT